MTAADRKQRLQRLERILVWSPIYFVTTCTNERRPIWPQNLFTGLLFNSLEKVSIAAHGSAPTYLCLTTFIYSSGLTIGRSN